VVEVGLVVGLERDKKREVLWGWRFSLLGVADKACEGSEVGSDNFFE
jgi:hypothetical protein